VAEGRAQRGGAERGSAGGVPVHIFSGFLGSGKTTAIRAQLDACHRRGERVAVIVNDFGEASFDEATLAEGEPYRITNIPGGCVCCTAPEGFVAALGAVLEERPDRLLIEPTGLARPQDLVDTIRRGPQRDAFELAPVVVLVDPQVLLQDEQGGDTPTRALLREQLQVADVLVANRIDLAKPEALAAFDRRAAELWPAPLAIHRTRHGALPSQALEWPPGEGARSERHAAHEGHEHAPSTAGFLARSWRWSPEVVFSGRRLRDGLAALAGDVSVVRFKGIFRTEEGTSRLEIAGGVLHDRLTSYRRDSRADAIAAQGDAGALDRVAAALEAAALREDELRGDPSRIEWVLPDGRVLTADRAALLALPGGIPDVSAQFPKRSGAAARIEALFEAWALPKDGSAVVVAGDGFASEPVAISVLRRGVLLHSLDEEPLAAAQGGPFRLLIPADATPEPVSCANVKGVAKIVLRAGSGGAPVSG
jgi:G3E family GTPase